MEDPQKIFTLEEANALLPELASLLAALQAKRDAFQRFEDQLFFQEILEGAVPEESCFQRLEASLIQLETEIGKIRSLGCRLRHAEQGLVDFLARRGGGWIYYCWQQGEKEIRFYHTLGGGFFERRLLNS